MTKPKVVSSKFVEADNLPKKISQKLGFHKGLVRMDLTHSSPYKIVFRAVKGTFADNVAKAIKQ